MSLHNQRATIKLEDIYSILYSNNVIYIGSGRKMLDVQYMFGFQNYKCISIDIEDNSLSANNIISRYVWGTDISVCLTDISSTVYIICSNYDVEIGNMLTYKGKKRLKDFFLIEDIVKLLDLPFSVWDKKKKKTLCLAEMTDSEKRSIMEYYNIYIENIDNDISSSIDSPEENSICLIAHNRSRNIERYAKAGYKYNKNMFVIPTENKRNSAYFMDMINHDTVDMSICSHPFEFIEIIPSRDSRGISGAVHMCCPMFLKEPVGYLRDAEFADIWNSQLARIQRLSVINRTFYFCDMDACRYKKIEYINAEHKGKQCVISEEDYKDTIIENPKHIAIDVDQVCNLKCTYCRDKIHINSENDINCLEILTEKIINGVVPYCDELMLAGNGEVFASKYYKEILFSGDKQKRQKLQLTTNLLLMTKEQLDKICDLYNHVEVWVSIDASTKEAYESVRKNGKWEVLMEKLSILKEYKKNGLVKYIRFNYIVTMDSYKGMGKFISMAHSYMADSVLFQRLEKTDVLTDELYAKLSVFDEKSGKLREEVKKYLQNKIFKDSIISKESNIISLI